MQLGKISAYSFVDYRGAVQLLCQGENLCLSLVYWPVSAFSRRVSLCILFIFPFASYITSSITCLPLMGSMIFLSSMSEIKSHNGSPATAAALQTVALPSLRS